MGNEGDVKVPVTRYERFQKVLAVLRCPGCQKIGFEFEFDAEKPEAKAQLTGIIRCLHCVKTFVSEEGIVDLLPDGPTGLTVAQWSGQTGAVSWLYERIWRKRALGLMTGQAFPPEREYQVLAEYLQASLAATSHLFLDLACATGYYGRALVDFLQKNHRGDGADVVIGLDISHPMLKQALEYARESQTLDHTIFIRADATSLPLADGCLAGIACGGSLNEYRDAFRVLVEGKRVLERQKGRYFVMNLLKPETVGEKILQSTLTFGSGLTFFTKAEVKDLFYRAGLELGRHETVGLVAFSELNRK